MKTLEFTLTGTELFCLNNAFYRILNPAGKEAEIYNLPEKITDELIGPNVDHLVDLRSDDQHIYSYISPNGTGNSLVYVLRQSGEDDRYLVFYSHIHHGGFSDEMAEKLFSHYAVANESDVVEMWHNGNIVNKTDMLKFVHALFDAEPVHKNTRVKGIPVHLTTQLGYTIYMNYDENEQLVYWADTCFALKTNK